MVVCTVAAVLITGCLYAGDKKEDPKLHKPGWTLTFNDEFDGPKLDRTKWYDYYRDAQAHYVINDGILHLRIDKDKPQPKRNKTFKVSSIQTFGGEMGWKKGKPFLQKYGWFEIRCRTTEGSGRHCAFWLFVNGKYRKSIKDGGIRKSRFEPVEIDIMEQLGSEPTFNRFTTHFGTFDGEKVHDTLPVKKRYKRYNLGFDQTKEFATYALEWTPKELIWHLNGKKIYSQPYSAQVPFYIMLSIYESLPGQKSWTGKHVPRPYPRDFEIDYIRVYKRADMAK